MSFFCAANAWENLFRKITCFSTNGKSRGYYSPKLRRRLFPDCLQRHSKSCVWMCCTCTTQTLISVSSMHDASRRTSFSISCNLWLCAQNWSGCAGPENEAFTALCESFTVASFAEASLGARSMTWGAWRALNESVLSELPIRMPVAAHPDKKKHKTTKESR